jgi:hypothetical protein
VKTLEKLFCREQSQKVEEPRPTKSCPPGMGAIAIVIGLCMVVFGLVADQSHFPHGRWSPILCGIMFALAGIQVVRVSALHQAADSIGTSVIAILLYLSFSVVLFWAAFSNVVFQDENGNTAKNQWIGHVVFFILGVGALVGVVLFSRKLIGQLNNRK